MRAMPIPRRRKPRAVSTPVVLDLERQEKLARTLLRSATRALADATAILAVDDAPNPRQIADVDDRLALVRRRWSAWDLARRQVGEQRRDRRRET